VGLGLTTVVLLLLPLTACKPPASTSTVVSLTTLPAPLTTFFPPATTQQTITFLPPVTTLNTTTLLPTLTVPAPTAIPTTTTQPTTTTTSANTTNTTTASVLTTVSPVPSTTTTAPPVKTLFPPAGAKVIVIEDPIGDIFNSQKQPVQAEPFLDIVSAEIYTTGAASFLSLKLASKIPSRVEIPDLFLEWDFFIDADMNSTTGWTGELIANDIGPDYLVRLIISDKPSADIYDVKLNKISSIDCQVMEDTIDFAFSASILKLDRFNLVAVTRRWFGGELTAIDKAPGDGHYNMPKGHVIVAPGLPARRLESQHATIWYNEGNDERASYCAEAFEAAYSEAGRLWGIHPVSSTIYVYTSRTEMVAGLQAFSHLDKDKSLTYQYYGAPRPTDHITHIPPDFDWRAIYQQQIAVTMDLFC
jgi:hypothetical protein